MELQPQCVWPIMYDKYGLLCMSIVSTSGILSYSLHNLFLLTSFNKIVYRRERNKLSYLSFADK